MDRSRYYFLVVSMIVTLILAGVSFARVEVQNAKINGQVTVVCQEHRTLALIAKETAQTQTENAKALLPKISFPGLPHQQLVELTEQKELAEQRNLGKLEALSRETC